jgi:hypothetical protein
MPSVVADIVQDIAEAFDESRAELYGESSKVMLLKENGVTKAFDIIATVETGWTAEFSEFFNTTTVDIADVTEAFANKVRKSTHLIIISSDNAALNNTLFEFQDGTQPPLGAEAYWKIRAKSLNKRISTPTVP